MNMAWVFLGGIVVGFVIGILIAFGNESRKDDMYVRSSWDDKVNLNDFPPKRVQALKRGRKK